MQKKRYSKELGGTVGCSMRTIEPTQYSGRLVKQRIGTKEAGKREVFLGDLRFTSQRLCEGLRNKLGHESFGALKTAHSSTPKAEIDKIMNNWPAGSYLVLECKDTGLFMLGTNTITKRKVRLQFPVHAA